MNLEAAQIAASLRGVWSSTILAGTVGSTVHGLHVADGVEDLDIMGVCVEPIRMAMGLTKFEQFIHRTAIEREKDHNARSRAGDVDMTIYSLQKYIRLALSGNPTILTLLFVPAESLIMARTAGLRLQALAPMLVSKKAGGAYLGYMQAQRQRLLGERGGRHGSRPELTNKFGYDSKYAAHVVRLGLQGVELMMTGRLTLPMAPLDRDAVLEIRKGNIPFNLCMSLAGNVERQLKDAIDASPLPDQPNKDMVESWMIETYQRYFDNLVYDDAPFTPEEL